MRKNSFLLILLFALVWSCSKNDQLTRSASTTYKGGGKTPGYTPASPVVITADVMGAQNLLFSLDTKTRFSQVVDGGYTYSITNKPAWATIDTATGLLTGVPDAQGVTENVVVTATLIADNNTVYTTPAFSIGINGDPLAVYQWHIVNTGQTNFASVGGSSGNDINALEVYQAGITGAGIKIAVSDTGVEINHDDLYENVISGASKDYSKDSPYTGFPTPTDAHGTAVSGLIAARGWNNIGGHGVAPHAKFAGFQFLTSPQTTSILINQASGNFDIFNYSYGDVIYEDTLSEEIYIDHLRYMTQNGRGGRGSIYVKAAGNEFNEWHNANFPFENESPFLIVVGAINASGIKASYANAGSNLWISAPGGEYGSDFPALISADLPGCLKGFSKATSSPVNSFEYGHNLNPKCNYTSTMNGTSAATPIVSGVIALMLEANPNLTFRDVKHILAATAVQVHAGHGGNSHPGGWNLGGHTYEMGWTENAAGYKFHNWYGFGLIDAKAAVAMAQTYNTNTLGTFQELNPYFDNTSFSVSPNASIPDNNAAGVISTMSVTQNLVIEAVQVYVQIDHPRSGEIGVELTSPSGTKSILMNINNSFLHENDSNLRIILSSNAFYGESSNGTWSLKVIDGKSSHSGTLKNWKINILGH